MLVPCRDCIDLPRLQDQPQPPWRKEEIRKGQQRKPRCTSAHGVPKLVASMEELRRRQGGVPGLPPCRLLSCCADCVSQQFPVHSENNIYEKKCKSTSRQHIDCARTFWFRTLSRAGEVLACRCTTTTQLPRDSLDMCSCTQDKLQAFPTKTQPQQHSPGTGRGGATGHSNLTRMAPRGNGSEHKTANSAALTLY